MKTSPITPTQHDIDRRKLADHVLRTFKRESGGQLSAWTYLGDGGGKWTAFVNSGKYYQPQEDRELILTAIPNLRKQFSDVSTIVDFGSGDEIGVSKTIPLIRALPEVRAYVPIDLSSELLVRAEKYARDNLPPNIRVIPVNGDFYRNTAKKTGARMQLPPNGKTLGVFWGSTISNVDLMQPAFENRPDQLRNDVIRNLKRMAAVLKQDNPSQQHSMAISWDANGHLDDAVESYDEPNWRDMILGSLEYIDQILKPTPAGQNGNKGFKPDAWHYEASIDAHNFTVQQLIVADRPQQFRINGQFINITRGDKFVIVNNAKMPTHFMRHCIEEAGFTPHPHDGRLFIPSNQSRMAIMTFDI